jgi:hypothetical protein
MRCEEVRPHLPNLAEGVPRPAGPIEEHLASCAACSEELDRYRRVVVELGALREVLMEPTAGFLGRLLAEIPEPVRRRFIHRLASDERLHRAVFSLGGVVVGATAIGLLWWRIARRDLATAEVEGAGTI